MIVPARRYRHPNCVEFAGQGVAATHIRVPHFYPPASTDMGDCYYEAAMAPFLNGYLISHGYGGAHAMLAGVEGVNNSYHTIVGNVWDITAGATRAFAADHQIAPYEWGLLGVLFINSSDKLYVFWNRILVSVATLTMGVGGRGPNSSSDTHLFLGGSDHSNIGARCAWLRIWERNNHPLGAGNLEAGGRGPLFPDRYVSDVANPAGFVMAFNAGDGVCVDTSARGISHTATATDYIRHHGAPMDSGPVAGENANVVFNDQRHGDDFPKWLYDGSCPFFRRRGLVLPATLARTAIAAPGGELVWDSFGRRDQTLTFDDAPTLGSTEGGSLGALAWSTKVVSGQTAAFNKQWGLLDQSAIYLDNVLGAHAYVEVSSANQDVRCKRATGAGHNKETGLAFRVAGNAAGDHWICHHSPAYGGTSRIRLGHFVANVFTSVSLIDAADNAWTWLRVHANSANDIKVYTSTDGSAWRQEGVTVNNTTLSAETKCGLSVCEIAANQSSLARYYEFRVVAG